MAFEDNFKGDTAALLGSIEALLNLAAVNALVPPVPAMPLQLLQSAAARLSTPAEESSAEASAISRADVRAALKWVDEVYPSTTKDGSRGAVVEMTWDEFNGMRALIGLTPLKPPKPRVAKRQAESSAEPDYEAGFDWKAAWYALDYDAAQLRSQVEALRKELAIARVHMPRYAVLETVRGVSSGDPYSKPMDPQPVTRPAPAEARSEQAEGDRG